MEAPIERKIYYLQHFGDISIASYRRRPIYSTRWWKYPQRQSPTHLDDGWTKMYGDARVAGA